VQPDQGQLADRATIVSSAIKVLIGREAEVGQLEEFPINFP